VDSRLTRAAGCHGRSMPTTSLPEIPVRSADELLQRWAALLTGPVVTTRSLWLAWFDPAGRMMPVVVPVDDLPLVPQRQTLGGVVDLHDAVVENTDLAGGHLAMALCRPGTSEVTEDDEGWADALSDALEDRLDGTWSLHLAADGTITELVAPPWT
jgi:hypothetical protein